MKITNYQLYNTFARVFFADSTFMDLYFTQNSGRAYFRYKINTVSDVRHTGIYIGNDAWGTAYYVHNHYKDGVPTLITENQFNLGKPMYLYNLNCINPWNIVVSKALKHVINQRTFNPVTYNCQSLTNDCCNNQSTSEDAMKWVGRAAAGAGIIMLLGAIFSNND